MRAINAVYGYVAIDMDKYNEYKAVFMAQLEEEAPVNETFWTEEEAKERKAAIAKASIDTLGFGAELNSLNYIIQDLDPGRFTTWICSPAEPPDDVALADVDALILSSKTHCWALKRYQDRWVNKEQGTLVPNPCKAIQDALKAGGIAMLIWDQQVRAALLAAPAPAPPSDPSISELPLQPEP